jgi:hypothetical protein
MPGPRQWRRERPLLVLRMAADRELADGADPQFALREGHRAC